MCWGPDFPSPPALPFCDAAIVTPRGNVLSFQGAPVKIQTYDPSKTTPTQEQMVAQQTGQVALSRALTKGTEAVAAGSTGESGRDSWEGPGLGVAVGTQTTGLWHNRERGGGEGVVCVSWGSHTKHWGP